MEHSVCFIGHRKIKDTPELRERLQSILQELIDNGTTFSEIIYDFPACKGIGHK